MLMSKRSREALALAKALCTYWGLGPGAAANVVELPHRGLDRGDGLGLP